MSKRAIKTFLSSYKNAGQKDLLAQFLNDAHTGDIYNVITNIRSQAASDLYYTFFYELLEEDEIYSKVDKTQKKLSVIKKSKVKPKLL